MFECSHFFFWLLSTSREGTGVLAQCGEVACFVGSQLAGLCLGNSSQAVEIDILEQRVGEKT